MKKILFILLGFLFPILATASEGATGTTGGLSFTPPPSDYSVIFLANIFGVVDGVLHGTGSQIMGALFAVFNSAVLALGGIVIMYTLLVSTMNTAHEGQMLGQKWSSIWVPLRSTLGLALMIPKASGYCLMQIFMMWIVVQGVGAADKIWAAALSYLNRGGVVVQAQMAPNFSLGSANGEVATGAMHILTGQVCMAAIQMILERARSSYLQDLQKSNTGACSNMPNDTMQTFCRTPVPDFFSTINFIAKQQGDTTNAIAAAAAATAAGQPASPPLTSFSITLPNFDVSSPYSALNGICGTIKWNSYQFPTNPTSSTTPAPADLLTPAELQTVQMSRAIAIQQMFIDLAVPARLMVNNDPAINIQDNSNNTGQVINNFSAVAQQQFGIPTQTDGSVCTTPGNCTNWGSDPTGNNFGVLLNGTEFQGAIADYNGIMLPTLTLAAESKSALNTKDTREFIQQANQYGWILAGSYFFYIARLNAQASGYSNLTDSGTGLADSTFEQNNIVAKAYGDSGCNDIYAPLCIWLNRDKTPALNIIGLINGSTLNKDGTTVPPPQFNKMGTVPLFIQGIMGSTVNGYLNNASLLQIPGQPGLTPPQFTLNFNMGIDVSQYQLPYRDFGCGHSVRYIGCMGGWVADVIYNYVLRFVLNILLNYVAQFLNVAIMSFIAAPLIGMSEIFRQGVSIIQNTSVNPIIALANMGTTYINFAMELWIVLIALSETIGAIPVLGLIIMPLIALAMPLIMAWVGVMMSIGFITSYYIPFLPYMIFTFGAIAWIVVVIEAMVAAPIVALGVTHPEGNDAFGKGEHAIMIILNIFLRPSMMIIGYIAAISLSYVSVWLINAGFANALVFIQGDATTDISASYTSNYDSAQASASQIENISSTMQTGYAGWAGLYAFFFSIIIYTTMYLIVVQKAFQLIVLLPDKVLRWVGGQPESIGQEASQWGEEAKKQTGEAGQVTSKAAGQMTQQMKGGLDKAKAMAKSYMGGGPKVESTGGPPSSGTGSSGGSGAGGSGAGGSGAGGGGAGGDGSDD